MECITPRLLKGFRDFDPKNQLLRQYCLDVLQKVFMQYGFVPIDTPILEFEDVLLGKSGGDTEKQVYRFKDNGKRNIAMRYDLTVPFARYVAMNKQQLPTPFARYQIGKVFRGESPQKGRYREFMQCDFDIIGTDALSSDITILQLILASFAALDITTFKVHISHRAMLPEFLSSLTPLIVKNLGETQSTHIAETLRIIDKIRKVPTEELLKMLEVFWDTDTAIEIITFATKEFDNKTSMMKITNRLSNNSAAVLRLQEIYHVCKQLGIEDRVIIDPSITRGLDYYTGFVCETFIDGLEEIGSVCSGGRYNNLTSMFGIDNMPGVGASIGLDRLLSIIETLNLEQKNKLPRIVIMPQDDCVLAYAHSLIAKFVASNCMAQVYPLTSEKLKTFFKFSEQVEADFVCIIGTKELEGKTITIKNQQTREQLELVSVENAIKWIKNE